MNLKTTIALLILAGGCAALFWKGPELATKMGLSEQQPETSEVGATQALADLPVDRITQVVIDVPGRPKLELKAAGPGQPLELPGNWPIRRSEVDNLLATLHDLKSRFYPVPIDDKTDLKPFGLAGDQKPIAVSITAGDKTFAMKFGQPPLGADENPFTRPAYVRLEGKNEILRLGPQIMPILRRDEETYRRRQLFPEWVRVRMAEPKPPFPQPGMEDQPPEVKSTFLLGDSANRIAVDASGRRIALAREAPLPSPEKPAGKPDAEEVLEPAKLAGSWLIVEPVRDHANPDKLRSILTAVPNLWLEKFVDAPPGSDSLFGLGAHPDLVPQLFTMLGGSIPTGVGDTPWRDALNLVALPQAKSPTARLTVTLTDGKSRTVQIGRVARTIGRDEFRYAKLEDNPLIFELKADRLNDLLISFSRSSSDSPLSEVRDPTPLRFDAGKVTGVEIVAKRAKGSRTIKLTKNGNDWRLLQPVEDNADKTEVDDLIKQLHDMQARRGDIIDPSLAWPPLAAVLGGAGAADAKASLGLQPDRAEQITLSFEAGSGLKPATFLIGRRDAKNSKRPIMVEGWSRINVVDDRADKDSTSRFDRQPSAYRAPKLFDRNRPISEIIVQRGATSQHPADTYTLKEEEEKKGPPQWAIVAPFKAEADLPSTLAVVGAIHRIVAPNYVHDPKTDDPLVPPELWPRFLLPLGGIASAFDPTSEAFFGLDKPAMTLTLKFKAAEANDAKEPKGPHEVVIEIGRAKSSGSPTAGAQPPTEYYARLKGSTAVFLVPANVVRSADRSPEELVDRTLIKLPAKAEVQSLRRTMNGQELEIVQNNSALWEIAKPAVAKADQTSVEELINQLRDVRAARIAQVSPKELKPEYGLTPPAAVVKIETMERSKLVEHVLDVGNPVDPAKPDGERYAKVQGSNIVAVLAPELAKKLTASLSRFRDLNLGGFVTADRIVLERGERKVAFVKGPDGWKLKEPLDAGAEDQDLRELHDSLAKLRAEEIVEDHAKDLVKYGLDKPEQWRLYNGDREVMHLLVGSRNKTGNRSYAMLAKGGQVALLDPQLTSWLAREYRQRQLWEAFPEMQIKEIAVKGPEAKESFTLVRGALGWLDPAKPAEKLNLETVGELARALASLHAERYVVDEGGDLKKYGLDKAKSISVTTEDGKKHTVLLGELLDGKRYYAKLDNPARPGVVLLSEFESSALSRARADYAPKPKAPKKEEPKKEGSKNEEPKKGSVDKETKQK